MKFNVNQKDLQEALSYCQGVIEKRSTLEILSNVLLNANNSKLTITATDLDLIFIHQIQTFYGILGPMVSLQTHQIKTQTTFNFRVPESKILP